MKRRGAKTIPAKFFEGYEEEAINFARIESNRQATQEDIIADVKAYKRAKEQGYTKQKLLDIFKKESRIKTLDNYSHLNEQGEFLRALNSEAAKSYPYLERNAAWVGELRKQFPQLTDAHEQELFDYFYREKLKHSFIKKDELFDKVEDRVTDITFNPEEKLALDKLESTGARARADTRDIQKKIDLLRARNRELIGLSKGAPPEQKNIFQREILANEKEIRKLEGAIKEIVNTQIELFQETKEFINRGELDEKSGSQIITGGDPEELEKLVEDIESKAEANRGIEEKTIREEINRTGEILYQKYIPYNQYPETKIETSLLKAYHGFDHELPQREIIITPMTRKSWVRRTQDEEIERALASFLKDYVEIKRIELRKDFIKRALKERPDLKESYEFLKRKLIEAAKKREKDNNILAEFRKSTELPEEYPDFVGKPMAEVSEKLYQSKGWFSKGERTLIQQLHDRRRHLELIIEDAIKKGNEALRKKAERELVEVDKKIIKERDKTAQYNLFDEKQESLFQRSVGIRKVYERMNEKEKKKFIEEIRKGINSEWLVGQKDLTKEQAKGLTDLIEKAIIFDPEKADITTAWEESFHASIVTLARPHLARNLLRENGWDGKGEIWEISKNPTLKEAHERLAQKYVEWRKKQEENPTEPKTRLEKLFQLLRELWAKIAYYLNKLGFSFEAGYFYELASGKMKKTSKEVPNYEKEINTEVSLAQSNFSKTVDDILSGKITQPVVVTNTPLILVKLGAKQLPITITKEVIKKAIEKHKLTPDLIKDLPKELHDPIMVFDSATVPNSFVIMTELRGKNGNIVVAIHLSRQEQNHIVNKIASVYGKDRDKTFIEWIEKGLLRYYNKSKSQIWLRSRGLQLPKEVTKPATTKILTEEDLVNNKLKQTLNEIQGELFPKDLKYYMDRIARISNIFELRNWQKKHAAEVEDLPSWERDDIIKAWEEQLMVCRFVTN